MKPIEAGCKVLMLSSCFGYEGKTATVIRYRGSIYLDILGVIKDSWEIEPDFDHCRGKRVFAMGKHMMRIDGFKPEITQDSKELVY